MAATVQLLSYHGISGGNPASNADVAGSSVRFKLADNDTLDTANPVVIPASGTAYSYVKQFKLNVSAWNTGTTTINNPKVFSGTNAIGTGIDIVYAMSATYLDPTTGGNAATALSGAATIIGTNGAPVTVSGTGTLSNPTTGTFTDYTRLQATVGSTATQGTSPSQSVTFQYDEF